jgi:hypothetical protein
VIFSFSRSPSYQIDYSTILLHLDGKRRRIDIQPPDDDESVVILHPQPPRDELCSILNGGEPNVPLTPLENDSIR